MTHNRQKHVFPIEKKLATIEWNLELLKASAEVTHTPLRTLKSIVKASVVDPTANILHEMVDSPLSQKDTLSRVWHAIADQIG